MKLLFVFLHLLVFLVVNPRLYAREPHIAQKKQAAPKSPIYLEKTTQNFLNNLAAQNAPPLYTLTPAQARKVLDDIQAHPIRKQPASAETMSIQTTSGPVSITLVRPFKSSGKLPIIMYFHGGGWILGNKHTHDHLIRELSNKTQAAVVFVNYALSPEARYPVALKQAYAATEYMARHGGAQYNLDTTRIAVAGDSVGGNLASVVTLLANQRGLKINYQALFYPVTDAGMNTGSYAQFAQGPWLTKRAMQWFWDAYQPTVQARTKPTLSPLRATLGQLRGLPPTLIITAENDVLRDEGEVYAHKLMQAGVQVTAVRYLGTIHDFLMLNSLAHTPAVQSALELASNSLKKAFKSV